MATFELETKCRDPQGSEYENDYLKTSGAPSSSVLYQNESNIQKLSTSRSDSFPAVRDRQPLPGHDTFKTTETDSLSEPDFTAPDLPTSPRSKSHEKHIGSLKNPVNMSIGDAHPVQRRSTKKQEPDSGNSTTVDGHHVDEKNVYAHLFEETPSSKDTMKTLRRWLTAITTFSVICLVLCVVSSVLLYLMLVDQGKDAASQRENMREEIVGEVRQELIQEMRKEIVGEVRQELIQEMRKEIKQEIDEMMGVTTRVGELIHCMYINDT